MIIRHCCAISQIVVLFFRKTNVTLCCEIFESDAPPIPKSTQEVGQALTSGKMVDKLGKNPEFLKIQGRRTATSEMTLCYLCNTEVRSTATCKIKFLIFCARSVISSGTMEGTDAPVRTPRRGKKQVIFCIFLFFFFLRKEKLEAMSQPAFAFCQCGDKLRLWPAM